MLIVGLNFAHDSGVCIVEDGRVLGLFQRERFARVKRKSFLTGEFLRFCLTRAGVDWRDVDHVAVTSSQAWPLIFIDPDDLRVEHDISAFDSLGPPKISRDLMECTVGLVISRRELERRAFTRNQGIPLRDEL
jgi:carbamoyltransferase